MAKDEVAVAIAFVVRIDDQDLGAFNSCDGLGCEVVIEQREEGGNNGIVWQLPTRMKFSNVKLSRPVTADSRELMRWFSEHGHGIKPQDRHHRGHAPWRAPSSPAGGCSASSR